MKKGLLIFSVIILFVVGVVLYGGCGKQQASSGGGSSDTVDGGYVGMGKAGALFASSGTGIGSMAAGSTVTSTSLGKLGVSIKAMPTQFFNPVQANGFVVVPGFHASESVEVRYITNGGAPVGSTLLASYGIASFPNYDWDDNFSGNGGGSNPTQNDITYWATNPAWSTVTSLADYMVWSNIATQTEAGWRSGSPYINNLLGSNHFASPEATLSEKIASMECEITFTGSDVSGDITMAMSLEADDDHYGQPVSGTGDGTLITTVNNSDGTTSTVTLAATAVVAFTNDGDYDTLTLTGTTADNYTVAITSIADGSGTGTIKDAQGTTVATITVSASGLVTITDSQTGAVSTVQI